MNPNNPVIRMEFKKSGGLKYISHLDLQRAVLRFIKRARIPVRYTEGFNPHPKLVFGVTLSVGCESVCELADVYLSKEVSLMSCEEFESRMRAVLPKGLELVRAFYPERSFSDIVSSDYVISVEKKDASLLAPIVLDALSRPVEVTKKTKSGERTLDVSALTFRTEASEDDKTLTLCVTLSASSEAYLNPDVFMKGLVSTLPEGSILSWQTFRTAINFKEAQNGQNG